MKTIVALTIFLFICPETRADELAQIHQISLGREQAPITIIEYTFLTCHHCADYHLYVLPLIKQKYINTGQLKYVVRPLPLDKEALMAFADWEKKADKTRY